MTPTFPFAGTKAMGEVEELPPVLGSGGATALLLERVSLVLGKTSPLLWVVLLEVLLRCAVGLDATATDWEAGFCVVAAFELSAFAEGATTTGLTLGCVWLAVFGFRCLFLNGLYFIWSGETTGTASSLRIPAARSPAIGKPERRVRSNIRLAR